MTSEEYWAYKAFIRDDAADEAVNKSEIFNAFKAAELKREQEMKIYAEAKAAEDKEQLLKAFDELENKIASNPALKNKFKQIKIALDLNPDLASKTDPNFINAINMLDLED